ncbi:DinB family protein [Deinococcus sp. DB0503]|uniref:DinB family protein n=1 Tax=Deinococcus sp. DB0503 TaxID=2479203 RepID=UPI001E42A25D|nr:DinB family protein [Deinococcus sp. DB0503]
MCPPDARNDAGADAGRGHDGGTGKLSHPSPAQFLLHMLTHDAHHRGQALLALKVNSFPLPGEDALWGPLRGE